MKNADRIRKMTDKELACFLARVEAALYRDDFDIVAYRADKVADALEWLERQHINILQRKRSEMTDRIVKLRQYVQFDFYTVDEMFVLQLFDKNNAANDGSDCIWEDDHFDFEALFEQAIAWCEENL